jgi:hypothetical protein
MKKLLVEDISWLIYWEAAEQRHVYRQDVDMAKIQPPKSTGGSRDAAAWYCRAS